MESGKQTPQLATLPFMLLTLPSRKMTVFSKYKAKSMCVLWAVLIMRVAEVKNSAKSYSCKLTELRMA